MDYTMSTSSVKGKDEVKMIIKPVTNLEREFFSNLFRGGPTIEMVPNGEEVTIVLKEKPIISPTLTEDEKG